MDTVLLFAPVLMFVLFRIRRVRGLFVIAAGFLPFVAWEAFSLFYYGFLFPNTAYAKLLDTGVGVSDRATHGLYYLLNSARIDPLTLLTSILPLAGAFKIHVGLAVPTERFLLSAMECNRFIDGLRSPWAKALPAESGLICCISSSSAETL